MAVWQVPNLDDRGLSLDPEPFRQLDPSAFERFFPMPPTGPLHGFRSISICPAHGIPRRRQRMLPSEVFRWCTPRQRFRHAPIGATKALFDGDRIGVNTTPLQADEFTHSQACPHGE